MQLLYPVARNAWQSNENLPRLTDGLRRDHVRLGSELAVLERAEGDGGVFLWQTLHDVCERLSAALGQHIRDEEYLLGAHHRSLGAAVLDPISQSSNGHYGDYRYLQVMTRFIKMQNHGYPLSSRHQLLADFLRLLKEFLYGLQLHMDQQEAEYFPLVHQGAECVPGEDTWNQ